MKRHREGVFAAAHAVHNPASPARAKARRVQPDAELTRILLRAFPKYRIEACAELSGGVSARAVVVDLVVENAASRRMLVRPEP